MALALNLCATGGSMFLKMYTYATEESTYLVDTLTNYFEQVSICKPYTSRIINDESYITCIGRNGNDCGGLPLLRPKLVADAGYKSPNLDLYVAFTHSYADLKMGIVSLLARLLKKNPNEPFKNILMCTAYKNLLYNSIKKLNFLFYGMGSRTVTPHGNGDETIKRSDTDDDKHGDETIKNGDTDGNNDTPKKGHRRMWSNVI
jgi:hypothetical protein